MPTNYLGRVILIAAIVLAALWALFPQPHQTLRPNLRPGIDMVGGVRLVYEIQVPEDAPVVGNLAEQVMDSLKRRVDPDGVRNLIWRPQGNTRLEIQMPLTPQARAAAEMRETYISAQRQLEAGNVRLPEVTRAVEQLEGQQRADRLQELANEIAVRERIFAEMVTVYDQIVRAREARDAAEQARLELQYDGLKDRLLETNLYTAQLESILGLSPEAREQRLSELRGRFAEMPERQEAIDGFVAAFDAFDPVRGQVDDAESLKRLLRGSGVLEFHIVVTDLDTPEAQAMVQRLEQRGPAVQAGDTMRWFRVGRPEEYRLPTQTWNEQEWALLYITPDRSITHRQDQPQWGLQRAYRDSDQFGTPAVGFQFDPMGARLFGDLTGNHVGHPMAILLDDQIISAPNIQSRIVSRGIITGGERGFTQAELHYLISTLNAGSLPAQLTDEPVMEQTVGPTLGADNLRRGLYSCIIGLICVMVFIIGYYYLAGIVAGIALVMNMLLILGVMSMLNATFTLPGVAAIVLTIGMAVDANVLIFERLREEQLKGLSLRMALRNGYDKAFSAILDSNLTTGITAFILYWFGSEEVAGFGITLMIGLAASFFTAMFVTRTIFGLMIDKLGLENLSAIPLTFPKVDQVLNPKWDWVGKAKFGYACSIVLIGTGLVMFGMRWAQDEVLDVEFTSGTAVQFELEEAMTIGEVRELFAEAEPAVLPAPRVVTVGTGERTYEIVTTSADMIAVRDEVVRLLGERLRVDFHQARFDHVGASASQAMQENVIVPITSPEMEIAGFVPRALPSHIGGAAIVLNNLDPPLTVEEIRDRIERQRLQPQAPGVSPVYREFDVEAPVEEGLPVRTAVVLVSDPVLPYEQDPGAWQQNLAGYMWELVGDAIYRPAALQQVNNFDAAVAGEFRRAAMIALTLSLVVLMIYIWIRFGNFKYGTATVVALAHDALFIVAAIGWAHYIAQIDLLRELLLLEEFRIDLTMIAALLTVIGYSLNDTIIIFDRIRENRGKYGELSRRIINESITQTLSRTVLTSGSTLMVVLIMYIFGGPGIHGFTFALLIGIIVGTYSTILIAAPILLIGTRQVPEKAKQAAPAGQLQQVGG